MKLVMVTTKYSADPSSPYLTNELAQEFLDNNHQVMVICADWSQFGKPHEHQVLNNIEIYRFYFPGVFEGQLGAKLNKLLRWIFFSHYIAYHLWRKRAVWDGDLIVSFSPSVATRGVVEFLGKQKGFKHLLVQWDFFPFHQFELGLIPKQLVPFLSWLETKAMSSATHIGCLSQKAIEFLNQKYSLKNTKVFQLPVWGPNGVSDFKKDLESDIERVTFVFGGQLTEGRGLDLILALAEMAAKQKIHANFKVIGDGNLLEWFKAEVKHKDLRNIEVLGRISRTEYLKVLQTADVGLVLNSTNTQAPSFPSKSIDYMRAGLPILGAVEENTDFHTTINNELKCGISCANTNFSELWQNFLKLYEERGLRKSLGENGRRMYLQHFSVNSIYKKISIELSL